MYSAAAKCPRIRYDDHISLQWVWRDAPCRWRDKIRLKFRYVPFQELEPSGSLKNPHIVGRWLTKLQQGQRLPPLIVSPTEQGTFYLRDGNHRYEALRTYLGEGAARFPIRVAIAAAKRGFKFHYRWFGEYGTYVLEPATKSGCQVSRGAQTLIGRSRDGLEPLLGRTVVLVAHADDEAACAALLQRIREPVVIFATDGAPANPLFWANCTSREQYAAVRRQEAVRALRGIGVHTVEFLCDFSRGEAFHDQMLHRELSRALVLLYEAIACYKPDALLTTAYEGGHPDHDCCAFLGHRLGKKLSIPVWEMPTYHRSQTGRLVHQRFLKRSGREIVLRATRAELQGREFMIRTYSSQADLADFVRARVEYFRPQPDYDFLRPPHPSPLNYEIWRWPMTGADICRALAAELASGGRGWARRATWSIGGGDSQASGGFRSGSAAAAKV